MSHHIHMLPQLLPLERPLKLPKRRRLRKTSSGEVSYTDEVDDIDSVDGEFAASQTHASAQTTQRAPIDENADQPTISASFSGPTMKALLQAQENK